MDVSNRKSCLNRRGFMLKLDSIIIIDKVHKFACTRGCSVLRAQSHVIRTKRQRAVIESLKISTQFKLSAPSRICIEQIHETENHPYAQYIVWCRRCCCHRVQSVSPAVSALSSSFIAQNGRRHFDRSITSTVRFTKRVGHLYSYAHDTHTHMQRDGRTIF